MARSSCTLCRDYPAMLPGQLCRACTTVLRRDLVALPDWYEALLVKPRQAPAQRVSGSTTRRMPADERAMGVRGAIRTTTTRWCVHLSTDHQIPTPAARLVAELADHLDRIGTSKFAALDDPAAATTHLRTMLATSRTAATTLAHLDTAMSTDNVAVMCRHLDEHLAVILATDQASVLATQAAELVGDATRVAAPDRRTTTRIGTCPCGGTVRTDTDTDEATCRTCGEHGTIQWWQRHLPVVEEWMPLAQLRRHLAVAHGVTVAASTLCMAASRGRVDSHVEACQTVYSVADAVAMWAPVEVTA